MKKAKSIIIGCLFGINVLFMSSSVFVQAEEANGVWLKDIHVEDSDCFEIKDSFVDSYGNEHDDNVIYLDASNDAYVSYDLNGRYGKLEGTLVTSEETGSGVDMNFVIFADGRQVYCKTGINKQMEAEAFSLDVTGVGKLEIKTSNDGEYSCGWLFIVDGKAEELPDKTVYGEYSGLNDAFLIDAGSFENSGRLMKDSYGILHNGYQGFDAAEGGYAVYNLDQKFVSFEGVVVTSPEVDSGASMGIQIYLDDQLVFSQDGITKQNESVDFKLDVTGVKVCKMITSADEWGWDERLYVVDDILMPHVHSPGDWVVKQEPTCEENGIKIQYCVECSEECNSEDIEAAGHIPGDKFEVEKKATCSEEGTEVKRCTICNQVCETKSIEKKEHTPEGDWTVAEEATCESDGRMVKKCKVCGAEIESRPIEKKEHIASENIKEVMAATCTEPGVGEVYCANCGEFLENKPIPVLGHDFGKWTAVEGSIWDTPIIKERICSRCFLRESKKIYAWIWVKPLVIVLMILTGVFIIKAILKKYPVNQQTWNKNLESVKDSLKEKIEDVKQKREKKKQNSEEDFEDILNQHEK